MRLPTNLISNSNVLIIGTWWPKLVWRIHNSGGFKIDFNTGLQISTKIGESRCWIFNTLRFTGGITYPPTLELITFTVSVGGFSTHDFWISHVGKEKWNMEIEMGFFQYITTVFLCKDWTWIQGPKSCLCETKGTGGPLFWPHFLRKQWWWDDVRGLAWAADEKSTWTRSGDGSDHSMKVQTQFDGSGVFSYRYIVFWMCNQMLELYRMGQFGFRKHYFLVQGVQEPKQYTSNYFGLLKLLGYLTHLYTRIGGKNNLRHPQET